MKHSSLPILVLAASCNMLLVSGLEKSSVEYRRNRKSHVVHDQEQALVLPRKDDEANQLRHAISRRTNSNQSSEDQQFERQATNSSNRRRTRGSKSNTKRQSRRELSKSSGKSGSKSSSKSGSSSSSGGSSSGGGSSGSGGSSGGGSDSSQKSSGYNSDDGTYCGCLCDNAYSDYGFDTHGISCDYHVEEYSYGEGVRYVLKSNSVFTFEIPKLKRFEFLFWYTEKYLTPVFFNFAVTRILTTATLSWRSTLRTIDTRNGQ